MNAKVCGKCKIEKPVSEFSKDSRTKDGLQARCKGCWREYHQQRSRQPKTVVGEKHCNKCDTTKAVSEFSKDSHAKDGLRTRCRSCDSQYHQQKKSRPKTVVDEKHCNGCNTTKAATEFIKSSSKRDGLQTRCKCCQNKYKLQYAKERRRNDGAFRLASVMRNTANRGLHSKSRRTHEYIGMSYDDLYKHLCSMIPEGHDLKDYHIDHIRPIASFNLLNEDGTENWLECRRCFGWENLQPLTAEENQKKSDTWDGDSSHLYQGE